MRRSHRDDVQTGGFSGERVFASGADVRYVLHTATASPDTLVVAFSSAQAPGAPPRYRWQKVLGDVPCHRLFVLDDHGPLGPRAGPSWYLGRHRGPDVAGSVCELIERTAQELGVERGRTVTIGSSMGGWAALYFAARVGAGHAIAGEPQTRLGSYLCCTAFHGIAEHIAGGSSPREGRFLDAILFDALRAAPTLPRLHVYCGRESPYYEAHVVPLLDAVDELGAEVELELGDSSEHDDISERFGPYLLRRLDKVREGSWTA
jgi:pimeloyl-ACP methyl ester carboxylesterase